MVYVSTIHHHSLSSTDALQSTVGSVLSSGTCIRQFAGIVMHESPEPGEYP
jgi:hypothetical protein